MLVENNGELIHYDPAGKMVFQRQQLDDNYYIYNGMLKVMDPYCVVGQPCELALIIDEPVIFLDSIDKLSLIKELLCKNKA